MHLSMYLGLMGYQFFLPMVLRWRSYNPSIFPNFQNCARCVKDLKDNKDNSLHLGRKYARIFVLGHYLFLVAHSFPQAMLSENCSPLGTDNVHGQISEHIFAPNGGYCLYILGHCKFVCREFSECVSYQEGWSGVSHHVTLFPMINSHSVSKHSFSADAKNSLPTAAPFPFKLINNRLACGMVPNKEGGATNQTERSV